MIPFGEVWHVPQILLNILDETQLQVFQEKRTPRGLVKVPKMIKMYNIEILPPISTAEFIAIQQSQLAETKDQ